MDSWSSGLGNRLTAVASWVQTLARVSWWDSQKVVLAVHVCLDIFAPSKLDEGSPCNILFRRVVDEYYAYTLCVKHDSLSTSCVCCMGGFPASVAVGMPSPGSELTSTPTRLHIPPLPISNRDYVWLFIYFGTQSLVIENVTWVMPLFVIQVNISTPSRLHHMS